MIDRNYYTDGHIELMCCSVQDVIEGRGMLGVDPAADLAWAIEHLDIAFKLTDFQAVRPFDQACAAIAAEFENRRGLMATSVARDKAIAAIRAIDNPSAPWTPPERRPDGYRCLTVRAGEWVFATWQRDRWWVAGYPFKATVFAKLPELPEGISA